MFYTYDTTPGDSNGNKVGHWILLLTYIGKGTNECWGTHTRLYLVIRICVKEY